MAPFWHGWALVVSAALAASAVSGNVTNETLGNGLWHEVGQYDPLPTNVSAAVANGWTRTTSHEEGCQPGLGIQYSKAKGGSGPTKRYPLSLYFTPAGQITGISTLAFGAIKGRVVDLGYWKPVPSRENVWSVSVAFRSPEEACSSKLSIHTLGDRAVINQDTALSRPLPMQMGQATTEGYQKGSCFEGMGTHQFYDLNTNGKLAWGQADLMNVVPMYDRNADWKLNAVFFAFPTVQQSYSPPDQNMWDIIPLANPLMCKNFCDSSCGWKETKFWSTMHIYFSNPHNITCLNNCKIGCCEK